MERFCLFVLMCLAVKGEKSIEFTADVVGQGDEEFETISTELVDAKAKYLERQKTKKILLQNVKLLRSGDNMEISGKKKCVQLAKAFVDSIVTEEILVKCFGAYGFLTGFATCRQIELLEFNHDCCVQVEELPGAEWGNRLFISLPEKEKHWKKFDVTVEEGDITNEDVDVIVNTTNKSFSFDGPLSRCIFQKAGSIVKSQIVTIDNELRFSHSGRLKCRNILHAAIPSSSESMDKLVLKILQFADTIGLSSIAMPTIGAGQGGWKSTDVASAMLKAFKDFEATDVKSLKSIKVMVFPGVAFSERQIFQQILDHEKLNPPPKTTKKEESTGILSYLTGLFSRKKSVQPPEDPKPEPIPEVPKASIASESEVASGDKPKKSQYAKLIVAASSDSSLSQAVNDLKNLTDRYIRTDTLEPITVLRLGDSDMDKIQKLARKNEVRVVVNRKEDIHSISIQGIDDTHAFSRVKAEIEQILSDLATDLPTNWTAMLSSEKLKRDDLQSGSDEYRKIEKLFQDANLKKLYETYFVHKIERVQNITLYRQYQTKKDEVSKRKNWSDVFERQLFHGTASDTIDKICRNGFNRSYAGKNATAFGEGTYFSNQSSYSNNNLYAKANAYGQKQMIVAEVLTGDYCKGVSSMKDAPKKPLTDELYDCVVDNTTSPSIFVVFRDWSAYPSYVITYSCI